MQTGYTGEQTSQWQDQYNEEQKEQGMIAALPTTRYNLNKAQQQHLDELRGTFQDKDAIHSITNNIQIKAA